MTTLFAFRRSTKLSHSTLSFSHCCHQNNGVEVAIHPDDEFQNDYSDKIIEFYTTVGNDKSALYIEKGNMHYYGGLFEFLAGAANRVFGLDQYDAGYHKIRHLLNALFGFLAVFFAALMVRKIAEWIVSSDARFTCCVWKMPKLVI